MSGGNFGDECNLWELTVEGFSTVGHPFQNVGIVCIMVIITTYIVSSITKNYSQVDKLWSIVPWIYSWMLVCDQRTLLMSVVITIWGIRLTYNFNRRGGYSWPPWSGDEDYRWALLQKGELISALTNPIIWNVFNFVFISLYQNLLLLLITTPSFIAYIVATKPELCSSASASAVPPPLNVLDYTAAILILLFVFIEGIADNQQWAFQNEKIRRRRNNNNNGTSNTSSSSAKSSNDDNNSNNDHYSDGFCQRGLFAIVRKPNYSAEQSIWISYYLFSIAATSSLSSSYYNYYNWSIWGCILLVLLFQGSGPLTEQISIKKYPNYEQYYMKRVPLYVPNLIQMILLKKTNNNKSNNTTTKSKVA